MSELTKEWLMKTIAELEEERDAVPGIVNEDADKALAAMELALASLEADVVAWTDEQELRDVEKYGCGYLFTANPVTPNADPHRVIKLYAAPPAPEFYKIGDATMRHIFTPTGITDVSDMQAVFDQIETVLAGMWQPAPVSVPDELTREEYKRRFMEDDSFDDTFRGGWNACRAAMLQGAEPVSNRDELPECLVKAMQAAIEQLDRRAGYIGHGYPQHCHTVRGFWDQGNGSIAHEPCSVCALWDEMRDYLSAAPQQEAK